MKNRVRLVFMSLAAACGVVVICAAQPAGALFNANPIISWSTAPQETYGDYSLMFKHSAGQYYADDQVAGQWAWSPQSSSVSDISWGDPAKWPPKYAERMIVRNGWVEQDGYSNGQGQDVVEVQRVSSEHIGDANCNDMQPLASDQGFQHYVLWKIPSNGYCLDAIGTITSTSNGSVVHFEHRQQWGAPAACSNSYISGQTCISQHEKWWDDNAHSYGLQLDRTQYIARGRGMGFAIKQTYPTNWSADMRYNWLW